jgi:hypothetical protein
MGALEDYFNQLEAEAQIAKSKMWSGVENAFVGFENYLSGKKSDFYGGQPTEEQMRLKRQQIKDQPIQATQEMRDSEIPAMPEPVARKSRIQLPEKDPLAYPTQGTTVSDQQLQALSDKQRLEEQAKYLMHQQMVDEAARQMVNASENRPEIRQVMKAPAAIQIQPGPLQEPPTPNIPAGWQLNEAPQEQLSQETLAFLTPEERFAVAQGYTPARVEAVHPAITSALNQASSRVTEITRQPERRVETTPVVNAAFEEMLKMAPEELRPMFRSIKATNAEKAAQQQSILQNAAQQIEVQRRREHAAIDAGIKTLPPEAFQYDAVKYDIDRAKALAERKAALNAAELSVYGMEPTAAENRLKNLKDEINKQFEDKIKPFDTTPQYKAAMAEKAKISEKLLMQTKFAEQINAIKGYMQKGEIDRATQYAKAEVAQTMNSLINSNAIQLSEMLIRYPGLLTADEKDQLAGKGVFNPSNKLRAIFDKSEAYKAAEAIKENPGFLKRITERASSADPISFIASAIDSANTNARALNSQVSQFIEKPTSPKIAGIAPIPEIDDSFLKAIPRAPVIQGLSPQASSAYQKYKTK